MQTFIRLRLNTYNLLVNELGFKIYMTQKYNEFGFIKMEMTMIYFENRHLTFKGMRNLFGYQY